MAYEYFISYRRKSGGISQAGYIRRILVECVGEDKVFRDLNSITEGEYPPQIENAIKEAKHFILIVNGAFFKEKECPDDWFFKEIRGAISAHGTDCITPIFFDDVKSDIFDDERMPADLKVLSRCQKLVYSKDNETHFDLFLRDHLGLEKPQASFNGYGEMVRKVFNLTVNVTVNKDDHSTVNKVNSDNTNKMNTTTINAEKVIHGNTFNGPTTINL